MEFYQDAHYAYSGKFNSTVKLVIRGRTTELRTEHTHTTNEGGWGLVGGFGRWMRLIFKHGIFSWLENEQMIMSSVFNEMDPLKQSERPRHIP